MRLLRAALALAAIPLGVLAYRLLHEDLHQTVVRSLPTVLIGWTAIASGLIAWWRRPANRMGLLMTAFGFAVLVRPWQYSRCCSYSASASAAWRSHCTDTWRWRIRQDASPSGPSGCSRRSAM